MAYQNIENRNHQFLGEVCNLISNYEGDLPNLRDIFQPEAIDWILKESVDRLDISIIDFVIETGYKDEPEIDVDGKPILRRCTPIHNACNCANGRIFFIPLLFQIYDRFDLNYADEDGKTHFHLACQSTCVDAVKKFLEAGQDPNCIEEITKSSPLHYSLIFGHESIELLLRNGANPNLANAVGSTPLHIICRMDTGAELLRIFLEVNKEVNQMVKVDARDRSGNTPLHYALKLPNDEVVELLLKNGANPNLANNKGFTPLHITSKEFCPFRGSSAALEAFFETNRELGQLVQVDARDKLGRTPLQLAVVASDPRLVDVFLDNGADLSNFVFPTELLTETFLHEKFETRDLIDSDKLILASDLLAVADCLEKRGYELDRSDAMKVMKVFAKYEIFQLADLEQSWYDDEEFTIEAKKITIKDEDPNFSLFDLIRLRPEEAAKRLTYADYLKFAHTMILRDLPDESHDSCLIHLREKLSRGFFRRWALDSFLKLTRYRLPILCCEMIIKRLLNRDLWNICLAATEENQKDKKDVHLNERERHNPRPRRDRKAPDRLMYR